MQQDDMQHGNMQHDSMQADNMQQNVSQQESMREDSMPHGGMGHGSQPPRQDPRIPGPNGPTPFKPEKGNTNVAMVIMNPKYRLDEPGIGLGNDGWRVLTYQDLVSTAPQPYSTMVDREMTINITANMERYMFSFDGLKFTDQPGPYLFRHNERLRLFYGQSHHDGAPHPPARHVDAARKRRRRAAVQAHHFNQTRRRAVGLDHPHRKRGLGLPLPPALSHGGGDGPGGAGRLRRKECQ